jgi:hypothetical protein
MVSHGPPLCNLKSLRNKDGDTVESSAAKTVVSLYHALTAFAIRIHEISVFKRRDSTCIASAEPRGDFLESVIAMSSSFFIIYSW